MGNTTYSLSVRVSQKQLINEIGSGVIAIRGLVAKKRLIHIYLCEAESSLLQVPNEHLSNSVFFALLTFQKMNFERSSKGNNFQMRKDLCETLFSAPFVNNSKEEQNRINMLG